MAYRKDNSASVSRIPTMSSAVVRESGEVDSSTQLTMDGVTVHSRTPVSSQQRIDVYLGETLEGRYVVESLLAEGGMGVVYIGRHKLIDKPVAIKILRGDLVADSEMTERFLNEAKAASSIGDPHIVDISDYGRLPDGAAFFVMELLDGTSLSSLMRQIGVVPVSRLIHIGKQVARGLSAAHALGIVHRDLKPDNVMLVTRGGDSDFVKVLDFGIAKVEGKSARLTRAGSVFGTPHYMSPEQAAGLSVDPRTDIYSLGVILYEMATGSVPFDADNFMGILTQHMYKAPPPLRDPSSSRGVSPGIEAVILKALSKKVELRYQTMLELVADLEAVERGTVPEAVRELLARSAKFDIPADYFRNTGESETGRGEAWSTNPVEPSHRRVVYWVTLGTLVAAGLLGALMIASSSSDVSDDSQASSASSEPSAEPLAPEAELVELDPVKIPVMVTSDPVDAVIAIDDGTDVPRQQPRTVSVGLDESVTIRIERSGYKSQRYVLDGRSLNADDPRVVIRLEREAAKGSSTSSAKSLPLSKSNSSRASAPASAPSPSPTLTARPSWCAVEDWDPFLRKCVKR